MLAAMTKPTGCDPHELAALARAGDLAVLDRMTRCYGDRLLAMGLRACRTRDEAQDAVQSALLSAGENLQSWRGEGRLDSWLVRMVANACHRMRRGRKNDPALHSVDAESLPTTLTPEEEAARAELHGTLQAAIDALPARDRSLLLLIDVDGWSAPEVAERLEMTPGSVRTRLSRTRAKLRDQLASSRVFIE